MGTDLLGQRMSELLAGKKDSSAVEVTACHLYLWREILPRSDFAGGIAVIAVTVATDSSELRERAADVFRSSRVQLAELLSWSSPGSGPGW